MELTPQEYRKFEEELLICLNATRSSIPKDEVRSIEHFISHTEIEMAFESLGLSIIKHQIRLKSPCNADRIINLGRKLKLDSESVFDPDFWFRLNKHLSI